MKKEFSLGEKFKTNMELHFSEAIIPEDTVFEIDEILEDGDYKIYFNKCIYDNSFKKECEKMNCEPNDEDGNVQICTYEEIIKFKSN